MEIIKKLNNPTKTFFGLKSINKISKVVGLNKKILVITSKRGGKLFQKQITNIINSQNKIYFLDKINSYPSTTIVDSLFKKFFNKQYDFIIGYGGGSVLDFSKILKSYLSLKKKIDIKSLIENIDNLKKKNDIKLILIPTTSGTGSEVTPFATIWDLKNKKKLSLNSNLLYANYAFVDPETTENLEYENRLFTGLDAINQLFDSYWNKNANYSSKLLASKGIELGVKAITNLNQNNFSIINRTKISKASLISGFCISKTRTSLCHSISYPLTSVYNVPHGLACFFSTLAVFDLINYQKKNFFKLISNNTNFKNTKSLRFHLSKIYKKHLVIKKLRKYVGCVENAEKLIKLMFTKGRSDNFCLPVSETLIKKVLHESFKQKF